MSIAMNIFKNSQIVIRKAKKRFDRWITRPVKNLARFLIALAAFIAAVYFLLNWLDQITADDKGDEISHSAIIDTVNMEEPDVLITQQDTCDSILPEDTTTHSTIIDSPDFPAVKSQAETLYWVRFRSLPTGALILINDSSIGLYTDIKFQLPRGIYTATFTKDDYIRKTESFIVPQEPEVIAIMEKQ